jgi:hypothetical protein
VVDEMICHALVYTLRSHNAIPPTSPLQKDIIAELARLVDHDLFHFLYELGRPLFTQLLITDILTNDPFMQIHHRQVRPTDALEEKTKQLRAAFEAEVERERKHQAEITHSFLEIVEVPHDKKLEIMRKIRGTTYSDEEVLFYFMWLISVSGFYGRNRLESLMWRNLRKQEEFDTGLRKAYFRKFGQMDDKIFRQLIDYPHVHISAPSYVGISRAEQREYDKERGAETLAFYDSEGKVSVKELDFPSKEEYESYHLLLSVPSHIAADEEVSGMIRDEFSRLFDSLIWTDLKWLTS